MTHRYLLYEYYKHTYLVVEIEDYQHKRFLQMYFDKIKNYHDSFLFVVPFLTFQFHKIQGWYLSLLIGSIAFRACFCQFLSIEVTLHKKLTNCGFDRQEIFPNGDKKAKKISNVYVINLINFNVFFLDRAPFLECDAISPERELPPQQKLSSGPWHVIMNELAQFSLQEN